MIDGEGEAMRGEKIAAKWAEVFKKVVVDERGV